MPAPPQPDSASTPPCGASPSSPLALRLPSSPLIPLFPPRPATLPPPPLSLGDGRNLKLRERKRGLAVDGLTFELTPTADDVMSALWRGNAQRTVAAMKMNGRSSRGHAILYLCIDEFNGDDGKRMGKLTLVDLAGMESSKKSFAVDGPSNDPRQREEAKHINTSLCALASVVAALSSGGAGAGGAHVPYRDSKLTRLLQDSLADGCSKTAVFVTLRTEPENIEETIATLRFAQRAKAVQVHVRPNAVESEMDPRRLLAQLAHSDLELAAARGIITNLEQALSRAEAQVRDQLTLSRGAEAVGGSPLGGWAAAGFGIGGPGGTDQSQGAGGAVRGGVGAGTGVAGRTVDEQHLASLELEVRFLRGKNRQLRARTVMQRFMHVQAQQKSAAAIKCVGGGGGGGTGRRGKSRCSGQACTYRGGARYGGRATAVWRQQCQTSGQPRSSFSPHILRTHAFSTPLAPCPRNYPFLAGGR